MTVTMIQQNKLPDATSSKGIIIHKGVVIDYEQCLECGKELSGITFDDGLCDDCHSDKLTQESESKAE